MAVALRDTIVREDAIAREHAVARPPSRLPSPSRRPADVRSIQRLPCPRDSDALDVTREYMRWLPRYFSPWLRVTETDGVCRFEVAGIGLCLLELTYSESRSTADRTVLYITAGRLARIEPGDRDRLEFRVLPGARELLAAIHDFKPALPWPIYKATQAVAHLFVMRAFRRHLSRGAPPALGILPPR